MGKLSTKQEKLQYIINELSFLKGLEFIDQDEIDAANYAINILSRHIKKLDRKHEDEVLREGKL